MARIRIPGFVGPSYTPESRVAAYDRTVNLIAEKVESGTGQAPYTLYLTPGFQEFCELDDTPVRGMFTLNGTTWAVGGESLYRLPTTTGGSPTLLTTGITNIDGSWVTIAGNGDAGHQLLLSSSSFKFCFDLETNTLTQPAGIANQVGYLDGYGIAVDTSRSEIALSALNNFNDWDPLDVAQRNDAPDKWVSMLVHQAGKEIWLFGTQSAQVRYNDPGAALAGEFPFVPNPNVFITQGIQASNSAAVLKGSPMWLGQGIDGGGVFYWANGYTPVRVSTHAVETAMAGYSTVSDARAIAYEERGHYFYQVTFPTANAVWVFDATTGFWHERGEWNGWNWDALPIIGHVFANGRHLVGSPDSGVIYTMSKELLRSTNGEPQRWLRRAPHVAKDHSFLIVDRLELLMETGLGLPSGQGANPMVSLSWSQDGGQTFGAERSQSAGRVGAFNTKVEWRKLGWGEDWVFQVTGSDPIPWRLLDAFIDVRAE